MAHAYGQVDPGLYLPSSAGHTIGMKFLAKTLMLLFRIGIVLIVGWGVWWLVTDPRSPLPAEWHPFEPLDVAAPVTWLTPVKLKQALASDAACLAALTPAAQIDVLPPKVDSPQCGIDPRVRLAGVGAAKMRPVETTCAVALRLAMWETHVVQPNAQEFLGQRVQEIRHQGSYNCRPIRSVGGASTRMSTHATAQAIDVRGVVLADGRRVELLDNYFDQTSEAQFYRALRDGGCQWFVTVLGPEFNALHADHFHMQSTGWGGCR